MINIADFNEQENKVLNKISDTLELNDHIDASALGKYENLLEKINLLNKKNLELTERIGLLKEFIFKKFHALENVNRGKFDNINTNFKEQNARLSNFEENFTILKKAMDKIYEQLPNFATKTNMEDIRYLQKFFEEKILMQQNHEIKKQMNLFFNEKYGRLADKASVDNLWKSIKTLEDKLDSRNKNIEENMANKINELKSKIAELESKIS